MHLMTINLLNACSFLHINWMVKQYLTIVLFRSLCHRFTSNYLHVDWIWFLLFFRRLLLYTLCATANTRQNPHIDSDYRKHRHNILCSQVCALKILEEEEKQTANTEMIRAEESKKIIIRRNVIKISKHQQYSSVPIKGTKENIEKEKSIVSGIELNVWKCIGDPWSSLLPFYRRCIRALAYIHRAHFDCIALVDVFAVRSRNVVCLFVSRQANS